MKTRNLLIALVCLLATSVLLFKACEKADDPNLSPSCEITAPSDGKEYMQGEIVTISVVATDSDGSIAEVRLIIDDESKDTLSSAPYNFDWNTSAESIGNHTLKAISFDNEGASESGEINIEIIEGGITPVSAFSATPTFGDAPLTVSFTDQSTNSPTSWLWDFGDSNTSSEQDPSNTYTDAGTYTVALTATNESGQDTETKKGMISVSIVGADFSAITTGGTAPFTVIFSDETVNNPTNWQWYFGDGESSTEQNPSHAYNNMGLYNVTLTASNEYGSDIAIKTNFITVNGGNAASLIDARDGQTYKLISVGGLSWFAENLNYETSDSWW